MKFNPHRQAAILLLGTMLLAGARSSFAGPTETKAIKDIKAYCIDFNWAGHGRRKSVAPPGTYANIDPKAQFDIYKTLGCNVIQTFCVSTNGYAWYKDGFVPEQPGLKYDFLPEMVKLGHADGMLVFGYFTIGCNPRWAEMRPDLNYTSGGAGRQSGGKYHVVYTDEYLEFISKSVTDAVRKTGIDGFMIDWLWQPTRQQTEGKWIEAEKKLYAQLMGEPFPGEDRLSKAQETAFGRKAIDRCWKAIRKAAKEANPNCIIWVTVNNMNHPHILGSDMYKEADWLMNEAGSQEHIDRVKDMVGKHTRLITCMALWNGQDAAKAVPKAMKAGIGIYGFTSPQGLPSLDKIFSRQISELSGDHRNIAVLGRMYAGKSLYAVWNNGKFVEPDTLPPFSISFKGRGRGWQDTASLTYKPQSAVLTVTTPYGRGRGLLERIGDSWPAAITINLQKRGDQAATAKRIRVCNGDHALQLMLDDSAEVLFGKAMLKNKNSLMNLNHEWKDSLAITDSKALETSTSLVVKSEKALTITIPRELTVANPEQLVIEWD